MSARESPRFRHAVVKAILACLVLSVSSVAAGPPPGAKPPFGRTFGDRGMDEGNAVQQLEDGGFLITGLTTTMDQGIRKIWLLKIDSGGNLRWQRQYGSALYQSGEALILTLDGSIAVVGATLAERPDNYDLSFIKTDRNGQELWNRTFGGPGWDWGSYLAETVDAGFILIGWTDSKGAGGGDLWLIKTDSQGNEQWQQTYGGPDLDRGQHVLTTDDGGYLLTGTTVSHSIGREDLWVIKTDAMGRVEWQRVLGGAADDEGQYALAARDGGYLVLGSTTSYGSGESDIWLVRLSAEGAIMWTRTYGGAGRDWGNALTASDDGYLIVGTTLSEGAGESDIWLLRIDWDGNKVWSRTYGGAGYDFGQSLQRTAEGDYIFTGMTHSFGAGDSDIWLIKVDESGRTLF